MSMKYCDSTGCRLLHVYAGPVITHSNTHRQSNYDYTITSLQLSTNKKLGKNVKKLLH